VVTHVGRRPEIVDSVVLQQSLLCCALRYCWYSDKPRLSSAWNDTTGPGALYYDIDNSTHNSTQLTGLGRVYMEKLCPINSA